MRNILAAVIVFSGSLAGGSTTLWAKGLEVLEEANPDDAPPEDASKKASSDAGGAEAGDGGAEAGAAGAGAETATTAVEKSASSKAIADNLFVGTSFGWVSKAARQGGTWKGSGMSDVTVGYKILPLGAKMGVAGTYRYAPLAVAGTVDSRSYRGVWEGHYLGARVNMLVSSKINVIGTAELGYVAVHMKDEDGLPAETKVSQGGASVALGGGADFMVSDKWACALGPRAYVGVGSFTTVQMAAAATFLF